MYNALTVIFLFFSLLTHSLTSAEFIDEAMAKINIVNKIILPDGSAYSSFEVSGASKTNIGKYGTAKCAGHRLDKKSLLEEQQIFCNVELSDGNTYSFMQTRVKTDIDAGVGKTVIIDGTGPFKNLSGKECIYAVKYLKKHAFVTTKCKISDRVFKLLKE